MRFTLPRPVLAIVAAVALASGGGAVAWAATTTPTASCTPSPAITAGSTVESFDVRCSVPLPAPVTSTVTSTVTVTAAAPTGTASPLSPAATATSSPASSTAAAASTAWPDATNTGVPPGTTLSTYTGPDDITTAGTVIDGKNITQPLLISAPNVTIKNSLIHGTSDASSDQPLIQVAAGGAQILNNVIRGDSATDSTKAPASGVKIWDDNAVMRGNNLYWIAGDGITVDGTNVRVTDNYVHDFTQRDGVHYDGFVYDQDTTSSVLVQHNTIQLWVPGEMSGVLGLPDSAPNITVDHNLLAGGGYTIEGGGGGITVTNNHFSRKFSADCGVYGTDAFMARVGTVKWSGNVWDDTGAVIPF